MFSKILQNDSHKEFGIYFKYVLKLKQNIEIQFK